MTARQPTTRSLEVVLARVLLAGTYLSIGLIAIGTALLLAGGGSPLDPGPPLDVGRIASDVIGLRPAGFLWLGVLAVLATPMLRVIAALVGFARAGEWRMVAIAAGIVVVVAVGIAAGLLTG